ncbi:hypothetical protein VitviT2T_018418 [Vitis vinifera]|uniref:Protein kinase domain-containing protein n=1 Tax=Vitis vinifera TaxID=29760 RepID=A0ABY9CXN2_VITVI|nr:probable inactive receptor kinase At2g26730 [Vitis vinifera]WKA00023.1 hypothetical protein VitviT2T_018418 [Vitis vinifera]|eukprot:XP_019078940.1 PREDICTED: probable inactive receptor kinase At2g26730 [Vitis vinifera]
MEPSQLLQLLLIFVLLLLHSTDADDPSVDSTNPTSSSVVMNDSADDSYKNPFKSRMVIIFVVLDVVGLIVVVWLFILYYKKAKKFNKEMKNRDSEEEQENEEEIEAGEGEVVGGKAKGKLIFMRNEAYFELDDLLKASAEGLGKGNFGNSYKAMLDEDLIVVVKRFRDLKPLSTEEFGKHLQLIAAHNHPNLLPPLAYYCSREEKLLVYKFADNGNLFDRLHGGRGQNRVPFRWNSRLAVAQAVARALEHLHLNTKTETMVPHGNLKSTNVLYTKNNTIVVSDYGLASIIAPPIAAQRMVSYKSPEYQNLRRVSKKSDVWSYGSLLLELLTGRIPSHTAPEGNGVDICSWVHRAVREEWTAEIFDHEICTRRGSCEGMLSLLQIAIGCCDKSPEKRPDMTEVAKEVANIQAVGAEADDDFSFDRSSFTDDSLSTNPSIVLADA